MEGERYTNISERGKIDNGPATRENDRTKEGYARMSCMFRQTGKQTDQQTDWHADIWVLQYQAE